MSLEYDRAAHRSGEDACADDLPVRVAVGDADAGEFEQAAAAGSRPAEVRMHLRRGVSGTFRVADVRSLANDPFVSLAS